MEKKARWQDGLNLVWGIWLFFSPFTLNYSGVEAADWNAYAVGTVVILFSVLALRHPKTWVEWGYVIMALWLFLAPFVLGFAMQPDATSNDVILSLLIGMNALWVMTQRPQQTTA